MRFLAGILAYLIPTFAIAFVWHLVLFEREYAALGIYRPDVIIPFGFLSMLIQAVFFAWIYKGVFAGIGNGPPRRSLYYGASGALLSWSFTTLAVGAKNIMNSVPDFVMIETAFTLLQWAVVAPLTVAAFGFRKPAPRAA